MVDIVSDLTAVKAWLGHGGSGDDTALQTLLDAVQAQFEREMGRELLGESKTEVVLRVRQFDRQLTLRHPPVTSITSVTQASDRNFGGATAMDSSLYTVDPASGVLYFDTDLTEGVRTLQVVYAGGMGATAAAFATAYPDIHQAANMQVGWEWRRRKTPGSTSESAQGANTTWTGQVDLLAEVKTTLARYNRRIRA